MQFLSIIIWLQKHFLNPFEIVPHLRSTALLSQFKVNNMATSGYLTTQYLANLTAPFNTDAAFTELTQSDLGKEVITNLWVNRDKTNPDFGQAADTTWAVNTIPSDILGIQVDAARTYALVYYAGIPDYYITQPGIGNEPTNQYGILKIPVTPTDATSSLHALTSSSNVGVFVNGSGIFNYTDTFSWQNEGTWSYDAFKAEAASINDDGAHATPTGTFHNHIQSAKVLEQLNDPFALGNSEHSLLIGYGLDGNPVYGPLGYTTTNGSDQLKVLRSSYVKRDWLENTSGNRSSLPGWAVTNWDSLSSSSTSVLNLSGKTKSAVLYADGVLDGVVTYTGTDTSLATEIAYYSNGSNGYTLKEDASGYAYWENTVTLPSGGTSKEQNYLLGASSLWGPGYTEIIQPGLYPTDRKDEFSFTGSIGSFAEDYEFVQGYGDLDFYNGINSYIPDLGKSEYHYVTTFSSNLADTDRLEGVAFPYILGIQYKGAIDPFNSSATTKAAFLASANNGLETVYDLGITAKAATTGTLTTGSVLTAWQAQAATAATTTTTGGPPGGGPPGGGPPGGTTATGGTTTGGTTTTTGNTTTTTTSGTTIAGAAPIITQTVNGNTIELIDLRSFTGAVTVNYTISREARFNNTVYFYRVDDTSGSVGGVAAGSANYLTAAFNSIVSSAFSTSNKNTESGSVQLDSGLLAPLIISNGDLAGARAGSAQVYTAYANANTDNRTFDHVQVSNGSTFGFEDLPNGGDRDFNDISLTFNSWTGTKAALTA
jgi:hypothetical protein